MFTAFVDIEYELIINSNINMPLIVLLMEQLTRVKLNTTKINIFQPYIVASTLHNSYWNSSFNHGNDGNEN